MGKRNNKDSRPAIAQTGPGFSKARRYAANPGNPFSERINYELANT
jgi:hypothetical protein